MHPALSPIRLLATGVAAAALGGALVFFALRTTPAPALLPQASVAAPAAAPPLPAFSLTSHRGTPFTEADLRGRWTFLFFGYTHCPDVCPTTLSALSEVVWLIGAAPAVPQPQTVFVSVDGQRDTPQFLASYMLEFNRRFIGATGSDEQLAPLARSLGVFYERHGEARGDHYLIDHTAGVFLIDPSGRVGAVFPHPPRPDMIAERYREITHNP